MPVCSLLSCPGFHVRTQRDRVITVRETVVLEMIITMKFGDPGVEQQNEIPLNHSSSRSSGERRTTASSPRLNRFTRKE
jgi:hypothetical protein